jgi:hypothetical protein
MENSAPSKSGLKRRANEKRWKTIAKALRALRDVNSLVASIAIKKSLIEQ